MKGSAFLAFAVLAFVSVALLLAIVALIKERRLRLALQQLLKKLLTHWRSYGTNKTDDATDGPRDRHRL